MKSKAENVKKNIILNSSGSIFYCACQWLITILVVHLASYEDAGYLGLAMTTSSSFSAISLFSMRNYQISDVTGEYSDSEYVGSRIFTCVAALLSCMAFSFIANSLYQTICVFAFMIVRVAEGMVDVLHGVDQKYNRYDYIFISFFIRGIVTIGSFCLFLSITGDLQTTLLIMAALNLLVALVFDYGRTNALNRLKPVIISRRVFDLLKKCIPIVIYAFLLSVENLIPKNVLQDMYGNDKLGIYSSIASPTLVVQVFAQMAFNPLLPGFARLYNEGDYKKISGMLRKVYLAFAVMMVIVVAGAMLLGRWGLNLLFGEDILRYYYLFMPIIWCTITLAIIWVLGAIVTAMRMNIHLLIGMVADFIICMIIVKPCVSMYDMNGVSFTQLISYTIYIIYLVIICEIGIRRAKNKTTYR